MKKLLAHLRWLWSTRNCDHGGELRPISGEERQRFGFRFRCLDCGKVLGRIG